MKLKASFFIVILLFFGALAVDWYHGDLTSLEGIVFLICLLYITYLYGKALFNKKI